MVRRRRDGRVDRTPGDAADSVPAEPPAGASGHWEPVSGTVLEARELDGYADPTMEFTIRLEPDGRQPFQAEIRYDEHNEYELYADLYTPDAGDVTGFVVDTGSGEVRFDLSDVRNSTSARILARVDPEVSGPPVGSPPAAAADRPRWYVPATCPTCGATVDQATASTAAAPICGVCSGPLPAQPYP
jgi:hypothetical protein